jgi:hypothetical protein
MGRLCFFILRKKGWNVFNYSGLCAPWGAIFKIKIHTGLALPVFCAYTLSMRQYVPAQKNLARSMGEFLVPAGVLTLTGKNPQR